MYANLDKIASEDKEVELNGKVYLLPGDVPVRNMVTALKFSQVLSEDPTNLEAIDKFILALFDIMKIKQPDLKEIDFKISFKQAVALFSYIYANITPEETVKSMEAEKEVKKKAE